MIDDQLVRRAYRVRSRLLCHVGRHLWVRRRNSEVRMGWTDPGPGPLG